MHSARASNRFADSEESEDDNEGMLHVSFLRKIQRRGAEHSDSDDNDHDSDDNDHDSDDDEDEQSAEDEEEDEEVQAAGSFTPEHSSDESGEVTAPPVPHQQGEPPQPPPQPPAHKEQKEDVATYDYAEMVGKLAINAEQQQPAIDFDASPRKKRGKRPSNSTSNGAQRDDATPAPTAKGPPTAPRPKLLFNAHNAQPPHVATATSAQPNKEVSVYVGRDPLNGQPIYKTMREMEQDRAKTDRQQAKREQRKPTKAPAPVEDDRRKRNRGKRDKGAQQPKRNDSERDVPAKTERQQKVQQAQRVYRTICNAEKELAQHPTLLESRLDLEFVTGKSAGTLSQLERLCELYVEVYRISNTFAEQSDLQGRLWRCVLHRVIDEMRNDVKYCKQTGQSSDVVKQKQQVLAAFLDFAQTLLGTLVSVMRGAAERRSGTAESAAVKETWTKCISILGDISRYKASAISSGSAPDGSQAIRQSLTHARAMYRWAISLHVDEGKCFNQLGLMALSERRELDSVYFYVRSLHAIPPFPARESLHSVLAANRKSFPAVLQDTKTPKGRDFLLKNQLEPLSADVLFVRLIAVVMGKTELDSFPQLFSIFFDKFTQSRLAKAPSVSPSSASSAYKYHFRLATMVVAVLHKVHTASSADPDLEACAFTLGFGLLQAVVQYLTTQMQQLQHTSSVLAFQPCLIFIQVVLAWCATHDGWDAFLLAACDDSSKTGHRFFQDLVAFHAALSACSVEEARAFVVLPEFEPKDVILQDRALLSEELELQGFSPLASLFTDVYSELCANRDNGEIHSPPSRPEPWGLDMLVGVQTEQNGNAIVDAAGHFRVRKVFELVWMVTKKTSCIVYDYSAGTIACSPLVLNRQKEQDKAQARSKVLRLADVPAAVPAAVPEQKRSEAAIAPDPQDNDEAQSSADEEEDEALKQLKARHRQLQQLARQQPPRADLGTSKLASTSCVIFDTNCYARSFGLVRRIIESQNCIVSVPLAVVLELQGLTRSQNTFSAQNAQRSLDYLQQHLQPTMDSSATRLLRAQTSKGTWVYDLSLASSEAFAATMNGGSDDTLNSGADLPTGSPSMASKSRRRWNMDDVILTCCLALVSTQPSDPAVLSVVLVTEDVNLRLKAHAHSIAVVNMTNELDSLMRSSFGRRVAR
ncbi:hypothetical protein RI367_004513 [Sorochytrium milnesiophthora]